MRCLAILAGIIAIGVSQAAAQNTCTVEPVAGRKTNIQTLGDATYIGGRTFYNCSNGVSFTADSAVSLYAGTNRILIGNVDFQDPDKTVKAARIEYSDRQGTIVASGDVTITDKKTGNRIHAPQGLVYNRVSRTSPEAKIMVYTGRPHITIFRGEGATRDTTDVDADWMEIIGERYFNAKGNVIIKRGALNATGGLALLEENGAKIQLWHSAHIKGESYDLRADSIYGETEADEFKEMRAFRSANLTSDDMRVNAGKIRILLDTGIVNRLIAVGGANPTGPENMRQAHVLATDFNLTADSIDALAPNQKVTEVIAIGQAMGARMPDSLDRKMPDIVQRDWLRGDTVIAHFTEESDSIKQRRAAQNDTTFDRVLEKLIASGAPATALYRMREQGDTTTTPEISYIAAKRIVALFKDGAVFDVDAKEQIKGVYLQPKTVVTRQPGNER